MAERWSPHHLRLHRLLLRRPTLLPHGEPLLLAVSGGQDSMALASLLLDLRRLHRWTLTLWHGDHGWRGDSSQQAHQLARWAEALGLPLLLDTWVRPARSEAAARQWRYERLEQAAQRLGAGVVVTGHTASDRAETMLLNLARGSDRRGLAALPVQRPLGAGGLRLVRPLLIFSRAETGAICEALELPLWPDPSNNDPLFSRNRIREEVLPVLNALHPGAERRISGLAERLADDLAGQDELLDLALLTLQGAMPESGSPQLGSGLDRQALLRLQTTNQRRLLHHWLQRKTGLVMPASQLDDLLNRLAIWQQPGRQQLPDGWQLRWQGPTLWLTCRPPTSCDEPVP
jgi:tRNA(Ile)-lysidine synthase